MNCPSCNAPLLSEMKTCPRCGTSVPARSVSSFPSSLYSAPSPNGLSPGKGPVKGRPSALFRVFAWIFAGWQTVLLLVYLSCLISVPFSASVSILSDGWKPLLIDGCWIFCAVAKITGFWMLAADRGRQKTACILVAAGAVFSFFTLCLEMIPAGQEVSVFEDVINLCAMLLFPISAGADVIMIAAALGRIRQLHRYARWFRVCLWAVIIWLILCLAGYAALAFFAVRLLRMGHSLMTALLGPGVSSASGDGVNLVQALLLISICLKMTGFIMLAAETGNEKTALILIGAGLVLWFPDILAGGISLSELILLLLVALGDIGTIVLVAADRV